MQQWEYLILTVTFGDNDIVKSVTRGCPKIFENVKMSVVLEYMDALKSEGWEVMNLCPMELGESYPFKKFVE